MIIVTGATGTFGRTVIEHLATLIAPDLIGVSVRDPRKASNLAVQGVRVRRGDLTDPASLTYAFEGATQVLIVSVDQTGDTAVAMHAAGIDAAKAAGARRVLYSSHMGARPDSPFAAAPDHAATETLLSDSGLAWTSLRNGFYASSAATLLDRSLSGDDLRTPHDGAVNWTTTRDLAHAAAVILHREGIFDGPTPPLVAPASVDFDQLAAISSAVRGRNITHTALSDTDYRDELIDRGTPPRFADFFLGMFVASRTGDFAAADDTLQRLLNRPPTTIDAFLAEHAAVQR